ncbi:MAG TPA: hypothetical protein VHC90_04905 [Bryobacteraceae bacterium]|nr:hypothetical protein [Bryobacteraceae bacterium]
MSQLFRRAESILEVASAPGADSGPTAIVLDREGQLRVLNPDGWTRMGLIEEFGAREVYIVKKQGGTVTVEGWSANDRCTVSTQEAGRPWMDRIPMRAALPYAARSHVTPLLTSGLNDLSPSVWNS